MRIADAAAVTLLRPGDRVDVIASGSETTSARAVAKSVRVANIPRAGETVSSDGALVVLSVPRKTATALASAATTSELAVTVC